MMLSRYVSQLIFWLLLISCAAFAGSEPRLYTGSIEVPTLGPMEMTLGISETDNGTLVLLSVPIQQAENIPITAVYNKDAKLVAELQQAGLIFTLKENEDQTILIGQMDQGGMTFPIEFERTNDLPTLVRPQTPEAPFPYSAVEITALHQDGHSLSGTLTIPKGKGPFACAVLISGSGLQDRDESLLGHKPFWVLADYLTRQGIAVLRFDDRGYDGSVDTEKLLAATSKDFASDVAVMVHTARWQPKIDQSRVGVIGHSEGGIIGPLVAAEDDQLAFVVMLAGPGVPGFELLPVQQAMLLQASGADQELVDNVVNTSMNLYELYQEGSANEIELRAQMMELVDLQLVSQGITVTPDEFNEITNSGLAQFETPWFQWFLFYDPAPVLANLTCPVLAMNGTLDTQVSSSQNLSVIEETIVNAGGNVTIMEFEGLNHLFQKATTGAVSEYAQIETTFEPEALEAMGQWLAEVTDYD
ncbi:MAG: alpha/beta fold hydrolase [Phycisphaerales bacterium]|nr:alpha/beta fold hydrolase [Phycisphaerales bacterium]